MIDPKNPFAYKQPKVYVTPTTLGPHRQRVFELLKEPPTFKHTTFVWVLMAFFSGFILFGSVAQVSEKSLLALKEVFSTKQVVVYQVATTTEEKLLGSDDVVSSTEEDVDYLTLNKKLALPQTRGLSFLVGDVATGNIILEKNGDMVLPIASISKLLTAVVAKEEIDLHKVITVSRSSINTYGTSGGLFAGEKIALTDLFYPLLIESSNDAAEVVASGLGRDTFMKRINEKASDILMVDTSFTDPSGLSHKNVSTARDLFRLAQFIDASYPELWDITRVKEYAIRTHKWQNGNNQLRRASFVGGKNGFTDEALKTSVSLYDVALTVPGEKEKQKRRIAIVVLKSSDRDGDLDRLLRYVEQNIGFQKISDLEVEFPLPGNTQ